MVLLPFEDVLDVEPRSNVIWGRDMFFDLNR
jgi:hypothetical protein